METGYDIIFFWVARMIMMGLEDTGNIPFSTVFLHGLVRDEKGEKMSKMKGNVLNPIDTLEKYGTDALRFALSTGTSPGNDIKLTPSRLEAGRNFANKLWNATRFILRSIKSGESDTRIEWATLPTEDRWILTRLNQTIAGVTNLMESFQFGEAQHQIYNFLWGEFCDWYIEFAKIRLRSSEAASPTPVLVHVLETSLRLLHPYMPFVTEELWQILKKSLPADQQATESIMVTAYPEANDSAIDHESERIIDSIIEMTHSIRNARAQNKVESAKWIEARIYAGNLTPDITPYSETIQTLAKVRPLTFLNERQKIQASQNVLVLVLKESEIVIPMESMVDLEAERKRLQKEIAQSQNETAQLEARLKNEKFLSRAPAAIIDKEQDKLATRKDKLERLKQQLNRLG
jgi:valyl-tRNA synthetase